jgi:hypothetical protein
MPLNELHRRVATVALRVATRYGFALGGGNALIAHGLITRLTQDVDLFTNEETGVGAAAGSVEAALQEAGFEAEREDNAAGLADIFEGMGDGLAEWTVTAPDGQRMMLQMAYFDRTAQPVTMDVGPVLSLEDVVGGKVCALVLLTELSTHDCRFLGRQSHSVARFLARAIRGRREGSSVTGCPACREAPRHRRPVGAIPAA